MAGAMLADCRVRTVESVDHGVIITALKAFNVAPYPARRVVDLSPCRRALAYFRENRLTMAMCDKDQSPRPPPPPSSSL